MRYVIRRKSDGAVLQDNARFGGLDEDPYFFTDLETAVDNGLNPAEEELVEVILAFGAVVYPEPGA